MVVLVNSCVGELDRIRVRGKRKPCVARPQERKRHAVSRINRSEHENNDRRSQEMQHSGEEREAEGSQSEEES